MSHTPSEPENITDMAAFRAQIAARMAEDGLDHDAIVRSVLGAGPGPSGFEQGDKPLPLHPATTAPTRLRLRAELVDSTPPIWRSLELPAHLTLDVLHDVLQVAFGFTDSHLHRFALAADPFRREFEGILTAFDLEEGDNGVLESELRLDQLVSAPGDTLLYTYDFGDDWEHLLTLEAVEPVASGDAADASAPVRCVAGGRRGPIEDVGGVHGWERALALAASGTVSPYSEEGILLRTLGLATRVGGIDDVFAGIDSPVIGVADEVDLDAINRGLGRLAGAASALEWLAAQPVGTKGPSPLTALVAGQSPGVQQVLGGYLAGADLTESIDLGEAEAATAVIRGFLGLVGEGIRLTDAGYLQPAAVKAMMAALDTERRWLGPANRESQTYPVLHLRQAVTLLGLTRKFKGELRLTPKGRSLQNEPVKLLQYVAARLPVEKAGAPTEVALLLLMVVAAGEAQNVDTVPDQIDLLSSMIGWQFDPPAGRYGNLYAIDEAFDTRQVLQWAGLGQVLPPRGSMGRGLDAPGARMLARAALSSWA